MPQTSPIDSALIIGKATDPGRTGKNNEDSFDLFEADLQDDLRLRTVQVAVVADGIGGNNAGEIASRITVEKIRSVMRSESTLPIPERMEQAIQLANQEVFNAAQNSASTRGMGSTVVIAALADDLLYVVHVGDSRAYLMRNNTAFRLTLDHTWAQEAIDHGILTPEAARVHPNRNVIKRYVGVDEAIAIDHQMIDIGQAPEDIEGAGRWPMVEQVKLQPGDTVLLCSDGLTDELTDDEIKAAVRKYETQTAADQLVAMANAHGGRDNITVVLLRVPGGAAPVGAAAAVAAGRGGKSRLPLLIAVLVGLLAVVALAALLILRPWASQESPATPATAPTATSGVIAASSPTAAQSVQPTVAVAPAETPTPIGPAPTASGLVTSTVIGGGNDVPTSTPIPTRTPSPEPPTSTWTPTVRPGQTASIVATSRATAPAAGNLSVSLESPANTEKVTSSQRFAWGINTGSLSSGQAFELRFWKPGQDPIVDGFGPVGQTNSNQVNVDLATLDVSLEAQFEPGDFEWGVVLVQTNPYKALKLVSETRRLVYERAQPQEPKDTPEPKPTEI